MEVCLSSPRPGGQQVTGRLLMASKPRHPNPWETGTAGSRWYSNANQSESQSRQLQPRPELPHRQALEETHKTECSKQTANERYSQAPSPGLPASSSEAALIASSRGGGWKLGFLGVAWKRHSHSRSGLPANQSVPHTPLHSHTFHTQSPHQLLSDTHALTPPPAHHQKTASHHPGPLPTLPPGSAVLAQAESEGHPAEGAEEQERIHAPPRRQRPEAEVPVARKHTLTWYCRSGLQAGPLLKGVFGLGFAGTRWVGCHGSGHRASAWPDSATSKPFLRPAPATVTDAGSRGPAGGRGPGHDS